MNAGEDESTARVFQAPPSTLRWMRTVCVARSGSTVASTVTGYGCATSVPLGEVMVTFGAGTVAPRCALIRAWPALSSTTARYCRDVPVRRALVSGKTWYGALSSLPIVLHAPLPAR